MNLAKLLQDQLKLPDGAEIEIVSTITSDRSLAACFRIMNYPRQTFHDHYACSRRDDPGSLISVCVVYPYNDLSNLAKAIRDRVLESVRVSYPRDIDVPEYKTSTLRDGVGIVSKIPNHIESQPRILDGAIPIDW